MNKELFTVGVHTYIVVLAKDFDEAEDIARSVVTQQSRQDFTCRATKMSNLPPDGWDMCSIPYSKEGCNKTLKQIREEATT